MLNEEFLERLADHAMLLDGLDAAVIGYDFEDMVPVYSFDGLIEGLLKNNPDWDYEDALEWFDFNISNMMGSGQFRVVHMELMQ